MTDDKDESNCKSLPATDHLRHALPCFTMYGYQNVRGLRMKTKDLKLSSIGCNFDIIALTETGLNSAFYDGELFDINNFCIYRCDRSESNSTHARFGGVMIAVKSHIPSERILTMSNL